MTEDLTILDSIAGATLSRAALARYFAYRSALVADGQDVEVISTALTDFLLAVSENRSVNAVH